MMDDPKEAVYYYRIEIRALKISHAHGSDVIPFCSWRDVLEHYDIKKESTHE